MARVDLELHGVFDGADVLTQLAPWFHAMSRVIFMDAIREDVGHVRVLLRRDAPITSFLEYYRNFSGSALVSGSCTVSVGAVSELSAPNPTASSSNNGSKRSVHKAGARSLPHATQPSETTPATAAVSRPRPRRGSPQPPSLDNNSEHRKHSSKGRAQASKQAEARAPHQRGRLPGREDSTARPASDRPEDLPATRSDLVTGPSPPLRGAGVFHARHLLRAEAALERQGSPYPLDVERCPICLEPLWDCQQCVATTFCEHNFHAECLRKYVDATCPVCRKAQVTFDDHPRCLKCNTTKNLWMCLNCGFVGCGRRQWVGGEAVTPETRQHALEHYIQTSHALVRQLDTGRVWDYKEDHYVGATGYESTSERSQEDPLVAEKQESLQLEYSLLIAQQLEEQRAMLQHRLNETQRSVDDELGALRRRLESLQQKHDQLSSQLATTTASLKAHAERKAKLQNDVARVRKMQTEEEEFLSSLRAALRPAKAHSASPSDRAKTVKRKQLESMLERLSAERDALLQQLS